MQTFSHKLKSLFLTTSTDWYRLHEVWGRCALGQAWTVTPSDSKRIAHRVNLWFLTQRLGESLKRETHHELFTESVNKIALSTNDDKRIIKPEKIPLLTGIGRFRLSDKTSTQTDNATGGLAKGGETGDKQRCWETQRGPTKLRILKKLRQCSRYLLLKVFKKMHGKTKLWSLHCIWRKSCCSAHEEDRTCFQQTSLSRNEHPGFVKDLDAWGSL